MALHVFRHVETNQLYAHDLGKLATDFSFADAGGACEQIGTDRLLTFFRPARDSLIEAANASMASSWPTPPS